MDLIVINGCLDDNYLKKLT